MIVHLSTASLNPLKALRFLSLLQFSSKYYYKLRQLYYKIPQKLLQITLKTDFKLPQLKFPQIIEDYYKLQIKYNTPLSHFVAIHSLVNI